MARRKSDRGKLITELLLEFPDADSRTLARLLYDRHPGEFSSLEVARSSVLHRGQYRENGSRNKALHRKNGKAGQSFRFPAGLKQRKRMMHLREPGDYLILSDVHVPYHSEIALEAALKYGIDDGCKHLVFNGDFLDFYKLSRWSQDPRYRNVSDELEMGKDILVVEKHFVV